MKWILYVLGGIVLVLLLIFLAGAALPKEHVAGVRARYRQPPERVFAEITSVGAHPTWRTGVERVEILSQRGAPLRWREVGEFGPIVMRMDESRSPTRVVTRIDDPDQPFGGRWIFELAAADGGTLLTITEHGEVNNPLFRFMSRYVFGHYRTLEQYARDLGKRLGETVLTERIPH
jgi:hypothetical protein